MTVTRFGTRSRYLTGVVAGESTYLLYSRFEKFDGTSPAIIACHNATGSELYCDPTRQAINGHHAYLVALAAAGFVVISIRHGGDTYGNATGTSKVQEARDWAQTSGSKTGAVGLFGWSAGAAVAMNFWNAHQSEVGAVAITFPAVNLTNLYADNASLQAGMDAAWSGSYSTNGTGHSPHAFAASLPTNIPRLIWYASDDTIIRSADVTSVASAMGVTPNNVGPGGHFALVNETADHLELISNFSSLR